MIWVLVCVLLAPNATRSQQTRLGEPERQELLNGLRILIWTRPADPQILLKLRIHSGAAFDLADKAGEMALLGDILFPDPATREYFEQMDGRLSVVTNYDSITVTMNGRSGEVERMIEILRNAVVATPLTPDVVASVRSVRIKIAKESSVSPEMLADRAIARRLFGEFPYGRPHAGSAESIARVDRPDLMLAKDRFLNPNNATLAIAGGVQMPRLMRALRQLLGNWRKSEQIVPSTFRQPAPPDPRTLVINAPGDESAELRLAVRGLARNDRDTPVAMLLAHMVQDRWEKAVPELTRARVFVRHEPRVMPGVFVIGASVRTESAAKAIKSAREVLRSIASQTVTAVELGEAKIKALAAANSALSEPETTIEAWLDQETYKNAALNDELKALENATPTDLQRVATRLFGKETLATVVVGNSEILRARLEPEMPIDVLGETKTTQPKSPQSPTVGKPD